MWTSSLRKRLENLPCGAPQDLSLLRCLSFEPKGMTMSNERTDDLLPFLLPFLHRIETHGLFVEVARVLANASRTDEGVRKAIGNIRDRFEQPWIDDASRLIYASIKRPAVPTGGVKQSRALNSLMTLLYARAHEDLVHAPSSQIEALRQNPGEALKQSKQKLDEFTPQRLGKLLLEFQNRARRDPQLAERLAVAHRELKGLVPELVSIPLLGNEVAANPRLSFVSDFWDDDPSDEPGGTVSCDCIPD